jgi:hypothetical protein
MTSGPGRQLASVRLAGPDDLGDPVVVVVEDVVEQERRALFGTE